MIDLIFKARLEADGVEAAPPNSPADYRGAVAQDIAGLEKFFKTPGISPDNFKFMSMKLLGMSPQLAAEPP